jgi:hypothetical protein
MVAQLRGYRFKRRIPTESAQDYLFLFENEKGQRQIVAWSAPLGNQPPNEAPKHRVTIPIKDAGTLQVTGLFGETRSLPVRNQKAVLTLGGAPQYLTLPDNLQLDRALPLDSKLSPEADTSRRSLNVLAKDGTWTFMPNTGEGDFHIETRGNEAVGVLEYDFRNSNTDGRPYVLAHTPINLSSAQAIRIQARSPIHQQLTFRIIDSTGQTLQFKDHLWGTADWETVHIPLDQKLEHWGGANDGKVHFPIKKLVLAVPRPASGNKTGRVVYRNATAVTE